MGLVALVSCGPRDAERPTPAAEVAADVRFEISSDPVYVTGAGDERGSFDLTHMLASVLLDDDRFVANRMMSREPLVVLGAGSEGGRVIARSGRGPGELMAARHVVRRGDTLVMWDAANQRVSWRLASGELLREVKMENPALLRVSGLAGVMGTDTVFLTSIGRWSSDVVDSVARSEAAIWRVVPPNAAASVVRVPDLIMHRVATNLKGDPMRNEPLRGGPNASAVVSEANIVTSDGLSREIVWWTGDGAEARRTTVPVTRAPITTADRQRMVEAELETLRSPTGEPLVNAAEAERLARTAPYADSFPAIESLLVDSEAAVWVVAHGHPEDAHWVVHRYLADGVYDGALRVPKSQRPIAFSRDAVALKGVDNDGKVIVAVHRLRRVQ
jgi:hypothetical protein